MILVVGGAGYIGSHVCRALRAAGRSHLVLDNFSAGHREAISGSPYVEGDIRRPEHLDRVFALHQIDLVMHFAAHISVGESVREPAKYFDNNVSGVLTLLNSMRANGVERFIFSSTAAIFGEPAYVPIDEDHPKAPTSPYGESKLMVEKILDSFATAYDFRSICLRYFNACGASADVSIGEDHSPEEHLIPSAIQAALGLRDPLMLFGTDYDTPDGTCMRDYIHVEDLASAHLLSADHLAANGDSRRYNLGNGNGFSVRDVIETVQRVSGRPVPHEDAPRRPGDPARLVAAADQIRADWGWQPQFTDLETIVRSAWEWHRTHPTGFQTLGP